MLNGSLSDFVHDHSDRHCRQRGERYAVGGGRGAPCSWWWKRGALGRVIGSDRFRRDGTNGRRPWFYLTKRLDSWALSLIRSGERSP